VYQYNDTNNPQMVTNEKDPDGNSTSYTYDSKGHVLTTTDARGIMTTNTYDSNGNLSTSEVQGFPPTQYSYDANGNMIQEIDPAGNETENSYDASGNLISTTVGYGTGASQTTTYTYDSNGNRQSEIKQNSGGNQQTIYTYDTSNRLVKTLYPDGTNTQTAYDSLGHTVQTVDQKGRSTLDLYDSMGRPVTIEQPDGKKSVYVYDPATGNRTDDYEYGTDGTTFRNTHTDYDTLNRPITVTYPDGGKTSTQYYPQGWVMDSIDENQVDTHFVVDNAGRKNSQTTTGTGLSQETQFAYDADGNQTTLTVDGQEQYTTQYDNLNRAVTVSYPGGIAGPSVTQYDNDGRKIAQIDQAGKTTQYGYDGQGQLTNVTQVTSMGNLNTAYTYDAIGNQLTQTDANTNQTAYDYDAMNRRVSRRLPDGRTESYTNYDFTGNLTGKTDFAGNGFTYGYRPSDDLLTSVTGPGVNLGTGYDSFLRRQSMSDPTGNTTFTYDERDRMASQTSPIGWGSLTFTYLYGGQVNTVVSGNQNGNNLTYEYDGLNRPATIEDGIKTTTIGYDGVGNLIDEVMPNGVTMSYTVDSLNRVTGVTLIGPSGLLGGYAYTLGPSGNRIAETETTGRQVAWTPDDLYRLTGEAISGDASVNGSIGYAYDPVGNRDTRTSTVAPIPTQTFTGDYTSADLLQPTFSYDQNGNQTSDSLGRTYTYNALNQLTQVTGTGINVSYLYDGDGLRVQKTNHLTGVTTNYLWDRNNLTGYPQVSEELQNGQVKRRYVYGPKGPLYMSQLIGGNWVNSFFGYDAQNVRFLTNDSGQVTDTYTWDAFGNLISSTGNTANNIGYDAEYRDSDTGLIYLRARWMNPTLGRFQSMDSYEGDTEDPLSLHKYEFTSSNPENMIDPSGNDGIDSEPYVLWPASDMNNRSYYHVYSQYGLMFTKSWEVYKEYPYDHDGGCNTTIGYGHLIHTGAMSADERSEKKNHVNGWSVPRAEQQLQDDTTASANDINTDIQVPLAQYEFDALVDFRFSIGPTFWEESNVKTDVNLGRYSYVGGDFEHFVKSNDQVLPGLYNRRCAEEDVYNSGKYQLIH
jgi:RHS repeat-associated protein